MNIDEKEISHTEEAGTLDDSPVKMLRTRGGLFICVGKPRGHAKERALAAGSHPAIVKYNMEKQYPNFQPSLMKSEMHSDNSVVDNHSHFLSDELRKSGHDLYSIQEGFSVSFKVTHQNIEKHSATGQIVGRDLIISKISKMDPSLAKSMASAVTEKALDMKASSIKVEVK